MRDYSNESLDLPAKKYSYNFDEYVRDMLVRTYAPFFSQDICLEIGCGRGEMTKYLDTYFYTIHGVDPLVNVTIEKFESSYKYGSIIMHNVLEHIDDVGSVRGKVKAMMKEEGRFFVSVPNASAASREIAVEMGLVETITSVTPDEYAHGHRRTLDMSGLMNILSNHGFRIIHSGGVIFKALSNWQMDKALDCGVIDDKYIEGCYKLGQRHPNLCATIYAVCEI